MLIPDDGVAASPLAVIIGPTAVGKTDVAIQVAQALDAEIISADSRQIYRKMDIGTAKPTPAQQRLAPHHLIDIADPDDPYNVTDFQRQATALIAEIHTRRRLPILVGGTGQYITAVLEGWKFPGVSADSALRTELEAFAETHGQDALLGRLRQVDPVTASRIDGRNIRRVIRALEVSILTRRPLSDFQLKSPPAYTIVTFGLTLSDRATLYARADVRIDRMLDAGFLKEVQALVAAGYGWQLPSMSALGYLQLGYYLQGQMTFDNAIQELRRATRHFIRRQYTWFRKHNANALWLESNAQAAGDIITRIHTWLDSLR
jgi:tRNA dimethylallyltransferase